MGEGSEYVTHHSTIFIYIKDVSLATQSADFRVNFTVEGILPNKNAISVDISNTWI